MCLGDNVGPNCQRASKAMTYCGRAQLSQSVHRKAGKSMTYCGRADLSQSVHRQKREREREVEREREREREGGRERGRERARECERGRRRKDQKTSYNYLRADHSFDLRCEHII